MVRNEEMVKELDENNKTEKGKVARWLSKNKWKIIGGTVLVAFSFGTVYLLYRNTSFYEYGVGPALSCLRKGGQKSVAMAESINMTETVITETTKTVVSAAEGSTIFEDVVATREINVDGFVRNLPQGWNASAEKIAEAVEKGIDLKPHQTIVDSYTKMV